MHPAVTFAARFPLTAGPQCRLDNDFIVFRGNDHTASGQLLKGTVVLCLSAPLKIENVQLKLTGVAQYRYCSRSVPGLSDAVQALTRLASWTDSKVTATGISNHKVDKTDQFFEYRWKPFIGAGSEEQTAEGIVHHPKGLTLQPGNYEWPFELTLAGNTTESVEGLREASVTYRLKATIARGKLVHDLHAYKRLRIIRTLEPSEFEFLHALGVESTWPNKIDYSIIVQRKAVVFGSCIPLHMRFTPLLKGLDLGDIKVELVETHNIILHSGSSFREHNKERVIDSWVLAANTEYWQDVIEESGQEGWVRNETLNLPRKLSRCLQDVNAKGIKIRHKLKIIVALHNPDGHISELRATLPVTIFISPNMPLDEEGNLVRQLPNATCREVGSIAPPSYNEHMLDQLYDGIDLVGLQTPIGGRSGVTSPLGGHSRVGSAENLAAMASGAISPSVLLSRLQNVSLEQRQRDSSSNQNLSVPGAESRATSPAPASVPLTRQNSSGESPECDTPEHVDFPEISELSKVPSYGTAVKTPVRPLSYSEGLALPDYETAVSAPASPQLSSNEAAPPPAVDSLDTVTEVAEEELAATPRTFSHPPPRRHRPGTFHRRQFSSPFQFPHVFSMLGEADGRHQLQIL